MYVGDIGERAVAHLVYELVANSIDQFLVGQATRISVQIADDTGITVSDDGPGLPYDVAETDGSSLAESYFLSLHNSPTADGHVPHVHLSSLGLGLVIVNALSEEVRVVTHRAGRRWEQLFLNGRPVADPQSVPSDARGTSVCFRPDVGVLRAKAPRLQVLRRKFFDAVHLHPGLRIQLNEESFVSSSGLADLVEFLGPADAWPAEVRTFSANMELEGLTVQAAATGATSSDTSWRSWVNGAETRLGGTHVQGFQDALRRAKWKPDTAMIHVLMTRPQFATPTRAKLETAPVRKQVREALVPLISKFAECLSN